jgi:hypothetical protein
LSCSRAGSGMTGRPGRLASADILNNRYHDPTLGRFISVDPLVSVTHDAYGYASNNPASRSDPSGLLDVSDTGNIRLQSETNSHPVYVYDDLSGSSRISSGGFGPYSGMVESAARREGVNPNLLASIVDYESKSLTNSTGTEVGDGLIDEVKGYFKSNVSVGLMQLQEQAVGVALKNDPSIASSYGMPGAGPSNMLRESAGDKGLSIMLGASFLKVKEGDVRGGLAGAGVSIGKSPPPGAAVIPLSSLVAHNYNADLFLVLRPYSNGQIDYSKIQGRFYSYGQVATTRMDTRSGGTSPECGRGRPC